MVVSYQVVLENRLEYVKDRFFALRNNLKLVLDFLHEIGDCPEEQIQCYQIMQIKTNFFLDEIEFRLRGEIPFENMTEICQTYSNFYNRSRNDIIAVLSDMCPTRNFAW